MTQTMRCGLIQRSNPINDFVNPRGDVLAAGSEDFDEVRKVWQFDRDRRAHLPNPAVQEKLRCH